MREYGSALLNLRSGGVSNEDMHPGFYRIHSVNGQSCSLSCLKIYLYPVTTETDEPSGLYVIGSGDEYPTFFRYFEQSTAFYETVILSF